MITKYDMTSGELRYQGKKPENTGNRASSPNEFADLITSLQLIEIEVKPESRTIPADLLSVSVADFLRHHGW